MPSMTLCLPFLGKCLLFKGVPPSFSLLFWDVRYRTVFSRILHAAQLLNHPALQEARNLPNFFAVFHRPRGLFFAWCSGYCRQQRIFLLQTLHSDPQEELSDRYDASVLEIFHLNASLRLRTHTQRPSPIKTKLLLSVYGCTTCQRPLQSYRLAYMHSICQNDFVLKLNTKYSRSPAKQAQKLMIQGKRAETVNSLSKNQPGTTTHVHIIRSMSNHTAIL